MSLILRTDADQGDAACQPSVLLASLATYGYTNEGVLGHKIGRTTDDPVAYRFIAAGRRRHPPRQHTGGGGVPATPGRSGTI